MYKELSNMGMDLPMTTVKMVEEDPRVVETPLLLLEKKRVRRTVRTQEATLEGAAKEEEMVQTTQE